MHCSKNKIKHQANESKAEFSESIMEKKESEFYVCSIWSTIQDFWEIFVIGWLGFVNHNLNDTKTNITLEKDPTMKPEPKT